MPGNDELGLDTEQKRGSPRDYPIMQVLCCHVAALTVASIFYTWRSYSVELLGRHRRLRDRVAYMLWVAADLASEGWCDLPPGESADRSLTPASS